MDKTKTAIETAIKKLEAIRSQYELAQKTGEPAEIQIEESVCEFHESCGLSCRLMLQKECKKQPCVLISISGIPV